MSQNTSSVMMIRPVRFDLNEQTTASNAFQQTTRTETGDVIQQRALAEFDGLVEALRRVGVEVIVFEDTPEPVTPDSIFPNNWVSFHADGRVFLYPMQALNRRLERRTDILDTLQHTYRFDITQVVDISAEAEAQNLFLEGTGSMILDRANALVYACLSPRTNESLLRQWCHLANMTPVVFDAADQHGLAIYHTNVVMCLGDTFAVICLDAIPKSSERENVCQSLQSTGHEVIAISLEQMNHFAGNMLQLQNEQGEKVLVMSSQAFNALNTEQVQILQKHQQHLVHAPIDTIERYGGGSARCMIAEVFLPKTNA